MIALFYCMLLLAMSRKMDNSFSLLAAVMHACTPQKCNCACVPHGPKVTLSHAEASACGRAAVVVQKRHHTRLFPTERGMTDRSGNVQPGAPRCCPGMKLWRFRVYGCRVSPQHDGQVRQRAARSAPVLPRHEQAAPSRVVCKAVAVLADSGFLLDCHLGGIESCTSVLFNPDPRVCRHRGGQGDRAPGGGWLLPEQPRGRAGSLKLHVSAP